MSDQSDLLPSLITQIHRQEAETELQMSYAKFEKEAAECERLIPYFTESYPMDMVLISKEKEILNDYRISCTGLGLSQIIIDEYVVRLGSQMTERRKTVVSAWNINIARLHMQRAEEERIKRQAELKLQEEQQRQEAIRLATEQQRLLVEQQRMAEIQRQVIEQQRLSTEKQLVAEHHIKMQRYYAQQEQQRIAEQQRQQANQRAEEQRRFAEQQRADAQRREAENQRRATEEQRRAIEFQRQLAAQYAAYHRR